MALVAAKSSIAKLQGMNIWLGKNAVAVLASKTSAGPPQQIQVATLRATYGEKYPDYPTPWPENKKFTIFNQFLGQDFTREKLCENSKVITVEGNIATGKTEFARKLAREFDLRSFAGSTEDTAYTRNPNNIDIRLFDELLSPGAQTYDLQKFLSDPHPEKGTVGRLQLKMYQERYFDYGTAMKHLLNTAQGVVMSRSVFSDYIFLEAMYRMGWVTRKFCGYYRNYARNSLVEYPRPHVTIYLDTPISVVKENIKNRSDPREVNSPQLSDKFLQTIDDCYRELYLPMMREHGEVLEIDNSTPVEASDMDVIAEELELLNLESVDVDDTRFQDWFKITKDDYVRKRKMFQDDYQQLWFLNQACPDNIPEVWYTSEELDEIEKFVTLHPGMKYDSGWAPELGHNPIFRAW